MAGNLTDRDFNNWLAGFIDGEGCFDIRPQFCRMCLRVREDEKPIMEEIVRRTKIGKITKGRNPKGNIFGQIDWVVTNKKDCLALIALLEKHPLRAKKKRDYVIWKEAVFDWTDKIRQPNGYKGLIPFRENLYSQRNSLLEVT